MSSSVSCAFCACLHVCVCNFHWPTVNRKLYERNFTLRVDAHAHCNLAGGQNSVGRQRISMRARQCVNSVFRLQMRMLCEQKKKRPKQPNPLDFIYKPEILKCVRSVDFIRSSSVRFHSPSPRHRLK